MFYAIAIIITAYLPIFTLQRVEGRLFKPMAWTVAFALLGAILFSMLIAPVLASLFFPKGTREWHNPVMAWLTRRIPPAPQHGDPIAVCHGRRRHRQLWPLRCIYGKRRHRLRVPAAPG